VTTSKCYHPFRIISRVGLLSKLYIWSYNSSYSRIIPDDIWKSHANSEMSRYRAGISTNGPAGVPFGCTPLNRYQYFTFAFSQFGNGCPFEYSYNAAYSTCVYTADLYNSQTWGCTWTVAEISTSIVNGGPTTAPSGMAATVTAPIQWVTVTSTQQIMSTSTSIVDPGAKTVTVSATQGASKLRRGESPRHEARSGEERVLGELNSEKPLNRPASDLVLAAFNPAKGTNSTDSWLEDRALCPYTDQIYCGAGCCTSLHCSWLLPEHCFQTSC
jgi:hypothetical protein